MKKLLFAFVCCIGLSQGLVGMEKSTMQDDSSNEGFKRIPRAETGSTVPEMNEALKIGELLGFRDYAAQEKIKELQAPHQINQIIENTEIKDKAKKIYTQKHEQALFDSQVDELVTNTKANDVAREKYNQQRGWAGTSSDIKSATGQRIIGGLGEILADPFLEIAASGMHFLKAYVVKAGLSFLFRERIKQNEKIEAINIAHKNAEDAKQASIEHFNSSSEEYAKSTERKMKILAGLGKIIEDGDLRSLERKYKSFSIESDLKIVDMQEDLRIRFIACQESLQYSQDELSHIEDLINRYEQQELLNIRIDCIKKAKKFLDKHSLIEDNFKIIKTYNKLSLEINNNAVTSFALLNQKNSNNFNTVDALENHAAQKEEHSNVLRNQYAQEEMRKRQEEAECEAPRLKKEARLAEWAKLSSEEYAKARKQYREEKFARNREEWSLKHPSSRAV